MRKFIIALFPVALLACHIANKATSESKTSNASKEKVSTSASAPADQKGLDMIASQDCTTCHRISEKSIGPAYTDVAKKYDATDARIATLAGKVIKGGLGNWGRVPMTPHPTLSVDSAREMVRYILNLKNAK